MFGPPVLTSQPGFLKGHIMIQIRNDKKRGCGWRKPGGLYLVADELMAPCGKLPIPLKVCPTCHNGIKPSRGWTWINGNALIKGLTCKLKYCNTCSLNKKPGIVGLLWIGEKFYQTPDKFNKEAYIQGVSRRISAIPKDFKAGETWVWLAHRKTITEICKNCSGTGKAYNDKCKVCNGEGFIYIPAVFQVFKPTAIEYVVKGNESEEEIEKLERRNITPVRINRIGETIEF